MNNEIESGLYSTDGKNFGTISFKPKEYKMSELDCEEKVGHKWESTGMVLTSNPPQYPEYCTVCGKTRTGHPQESMRYTY